MGGGGGERGIGERELKGPFVVTKAGMRTKNSGQGSAPFCTVLVYGAISLRTFGYFSVGCRISLLVLKILYYVQTTVTSIGRVVVGCAGSFMLFWGGRSFGRIKRVPAASGGPQGECINTFLPRLQGTKQGPVLPDSSPTLSTRSIGTLLTLIENTMPQQHAGTQTHNSNISKIKYKSPYTR